MKDEVLIELAKRWEHDAIVSDCQDGSDQAKIPNAIAKGEGIAKRECADALRLLVKLLGNGKR